jgi:hypothetical protein
MSSLAMSPIISGSLTLVGVGMIPLGIYVVSRGFRGIDDRTAPFFPEVIVSRPISWIGGWLCAVFGAALTFGGGLVWFFANVELSRHKGKLIDQPSALFWSFAYPCATYAAVISASLVILAIVWGLFCKSREKRLEVDEDSRAIRDEHKLVQCIFMLWWIVGLPGFLILMPFQKKPADEAEVGFSFNLPGYAKSEFLGWFLILCFHCSRDLF